MIHFDTQGLDIRVRTVEGKAQVFDPARKKWVVLTPEEHVRQLLLQFLIQKMRYPVSLMAVEKQINVGAMKKRFDAVIFTPNHTPWLLAECKAPDVPITELAFQQLLNYNRVIQCRFWLVTNGHQLFCADAADPQNIFWLDSLPPYNF